MNKGNLAFEYDQVHIICPVYEPGTFENETEKYIIYNVSKVEYETCRITNANPRIIAICDKPQKLMFFTITFRPFTPQPGGLEFLPGNDYYFICKFFFIFHSKFFIFNDFSLISSATSSKDDLHRRIGGRCSTNNMKVVFKVCCADEQQNYTSTIINQHNQQQHSSSSATSSSGVSINTNIDQTNRQQTTTTSSSSSNGRIQPSIPNINTNISNVVQSTISWSGWNQPSTPITSTLSVQQYYPHMTSTRPTINSAVNNNSPSHKPTKKTSKFLMFFFF